MIQRTTKKSRTLNLNYLRKRYVNIKGELETLSKDGRFTHRCGNFLMILGSRMRAAIRDRNYDLNDLEEIIINAEHYLIEVAQKLHGG